MQQTFSIHFLLGEMDCQLLAITPQEENKDLLPYTYYSHQHPAFELFYISEGQYTLRVGSTSYTVEKNQAILIPPKTYHSSCSVSSDISKMSIIFKIPPPQPLENYTNSNLISKTLYSFPVIPFHVNTCINGLNIKTTLDQIRTLVEHHENNYFVQQEELRALSTMLILELFQRLSNHTFPNVQTPQNSDAQQNFVIDEFFNLHFNTNDGNKVLAQKLNVSTRQLDRILKKSYGMSYREKLQEAKLAVALDFLQTTKKSITEIALLTGFSKPTNFSTFIKNATRKTPSELRKSSAGLI